MEKNKKSILKDTIHPANEGDVIGGESLLEAQEKTVAQKVQAKINIEATALKDILDKTEVDKKTTAEDYLKSFSPEERQLILQSLLEEYKQTPPPKIHPDEELTVRFYYKKQLN